MHKKPERCIEGGGGGGLSPTFFYFKTGKLNRKLIWIEILVECDIGLIFLTNDIGKYKKYFLLQMQQ